jgi:hypothetical protein
MRTGLSSAQLGNKNDQSTRYSHTVHDKRDAAPLIKAFDKNQMKTKNLFSWFEFQVSLLQVTPIIPSTLELQKWEDLDTQITCLITLNQ